MGALRSKSDTCRVAGTDTMNKFGCRHARKACELGGGPQQSLRSGSDLCHTFTGRYRQTINFAKAKGDSHEAKYCVGDL